MAGLRGGSHGGLDPRGVRTGHGRFRARVRICGPIARGAGWQINDYALELEREYGLLYASDTRGGAPFLPLLARGASSCPQLPTTLPTFDEILGVGGVDESTIADAVYSLSRTAAASAAPAAAAAYAAAPAAAAAQDSDAQVFTLHAELEGMLLLRAFESLLIKWQESGAEIVRMAKVHERAMRRPLPARRVVMGKWRGGPECWPFRRLAPRPQ